MGNNGKKFIFFLVEQFELGAAFSHLLQGFFKFVLRHCQIFGHLNMFCTLGFKSFAGIL